MGHFCLGQKEKKRLERSIVSFYVEFAIRHVSFYVYEIVFMNWTSVTKQNNIGINFMIIWTLRLYNIIDSFDLSVILCKLKNNCKFQEQKVIRLIKKKNFYSFKELITELKI